MNSYILDVIRQVRRELVHNYATNEFEISGRYFKEYQADSTLYFSNFHAAMDFIITTLHKDLD